MNNISNRRNWIRGHPHHFAIIATTAFNGNTLAPIIPACLTEKQKLTTIDTIIDFGDLNYILLPSKQTPPLLK